MKRLPPLLDFYVPCPVCGADTLVEPSLSADSNYVVEFRVRTNCGCTLTRQDDRTITKRITRRLLVLVDGAYEQGRT